jgi:hypothetical protein
MGFNWRLLSKQRKTRMLLEIGMCLLTTASLSVTTFAWFANLYGSVNVSFWEIHVSRGLSFVLKYYDGNFNTETSTYSGYPDPRVPGSGGTMTQKVTSYSGQFHEITKGLWTEDGPLDIKYATPGYCHTFALEITSDYAHDQEVELRLTKFTTTESTTNLICDDTGERTTRGVVLASDMDIYSQGYTYTADDATNATRATEFMSTFMLSNPTDNFQYNDVLHDIPTDGYQFFHGVCPANSSYFVLFTIEFTDLDNSTYHLISESEDGRIKYWQKYNGQNGRGTHKCYEDLSFTVNDLYINALGNATSSSSSS